MLLMSELPKDASQTLSEHQPLTLGHEARPKKTVLGIPESFFIIDERTFIDGKGRSGRELSCLREKRNKIEIYDSEYGSWSGYEPHINVSCYEGRISVDLHIFHKHLKHPDFEPRELLLRCFNYLLQQGNTLQAFMAVWLRTVGFDRRVAANTVQFVESIMKSGIPFDLDASRSFTPESVEWPIILAAAKTTWTGNLMDAINWKPQYMTMNGSKFYVYFAAPNNSFSSPIDLANPKIHRKIPLLEDLL